VFSFVIRVIIIVQSSVVYKLVNGVGDGVGTAYKLGIVMTVYVWRNTHCTYYKQVVVKVVNTI